MLSGPEFRTEFTCYTGCGYSIGVRENSSYRKALAHLQRHQEHKDLPQDAALGLCPICHKFWENEEEAVQHYEETHD
jgi:hypothetical protein